MFKLWGNKEKSTEASGEITWNEEARTALQQALAQAPVPAMMKSMVKKELKKAAIEHTQKAGRTVVTAEDLMQGLMAKLPANMKAKVEAAIKKGPAGLKDLEREIKN